MTKILPKAEAYWKNVAKDLDDPVKTKNKRPDTSDIEIEFYSQYLNESDHLLDIGSGSGLITNKLVDKVCHITAVEKFEGFTKFISNDPKILVINADLLGFKIRKKYDVALCTGVAQCFEKAIMSDIYKNIFLMLKPGGIFISRTHCGIHKDVIIDGYSEELGTDYYAEYRQKDNEIDLIKSSGFQKVESFDILPESINVWDNTRHYIFVANK